ncbi:hypothetical protein EHF33_11840 [Deinococcus psychrotolerans]|uniref:Lipoprotein n=1 Tax=Deinococcus psychrotolerans TaxID=2489213 RepID=A0A3G8YD72_9DEIO|nr:hypothetical protein [Deinococcus psychrotolerans]AZI43349.1 hypothetical protein EHF33_11840 [Deinococcus psychrotolerans]
MKQAGKKFGFQKVWLLGALALPLAGCGDVGTTGSIQLPTTLNVGIAVGDSTSTVIVTKTFTPATAGTPEIPAVPAVPGVGGQPGTPAVPAIPAKPGTVAKTVWTSSGAGPATFTFTSRPGSDAAYVTGFRLISDKFNGVEQVADPKDAAITQLKLNIYVPSGYTCPVVNPIDPTSTRSQTQSCDSSLITTVQGNGVSTSPLNLDFTTPLVDLVIASNASASRSSIIEFVGFTSRGKSFVFNANVAATAQKQGDL